MGGGSFGELRLSHEDTVAAASFSSALKAVASFSWVKRASDHCRRSWRSR